MFAELTFAENTELYMKIHRAFRTLDKVVGMMLGLGAVDGAGKLNVMNREMIGLLEDLNAAGGITS